MPNLLISVTGGAETFHLKRKLTEAFQKGLIEAAKLTKAWIITGGTNTGVMKLVGEAVRDHLLGHDQKVNVTIIGIVPWGCISGKNALVNKENSDRGLWPAYIKEPFKRERNEATLEPNHSHFLLVDNGTQHNFGTEISLRASIEKAISETKTGRDKDSATIPAVCIVLEGGPGTLKTVHSAIKCGTPCVVIKDSGRAADILAHAYSRDEVARTTEQYEKIIKFENK